MAELLRLRKGVPEIISLAFADGKQIESQRPGASPSIMFTLVDGRRTFLPISAAEEIRRVGVSARMPMEILKLGEDNYQIRCLGAGVASTTPTPTTTTKQPDFTPAQTIERIYTAPAAQPPTPPPPPVQTAPAAATAPQANRMMACFKIALDAVNEAQQYARSQGIGITFTSDNVTSAALSCYINACREGR